MQHLIQCNLVKLSTFRSWVALRRAGPYWGSKILPRSRYRANSFHLLNCPWRQMGPYICVGKYLLDFAITILRALTTVNIGICNQSQSQFDFTPSNIFFTPFSFVFLFFLSFFLSFILSFFHSFFLSFFLSCFHACYSLSFPC